MAITISNLRLLTKNGRTNTIDVRRSTNMYTFVLDINFGKLPRSGQNILCSWIIKDLFSGEVIDNSYFYYQNVSVYGQYIWISASKLAPHWNFKIQTSKSGVYEVRALPRFVNGRNQSNFGLDVLNNTIPIISEPLIVQTYNDIISDPYG